MDDAQFITIGRMQKVHLSEVVEIAEKNKLSYWSREAYEAETYRSDSYCLVAEDAEKNVAGFMISRLIMAENCAEIYNIAITTEYKRKGIGKKLVYHLTNHCLINNLLQINLEVREYNEAAVKFYSTLNFQPIGVRKNFYTHPVENAITMVKQLDEVTN